MTYVNAPVHDLLIRIKNAYMARKTTLKGIVYSNFKLKVLELLKQYNFVKEIEVVEEENNKKTINVELKPVINAINDIPEIKFYSKPSRPWYVGYKQLRNVAGGKWLGIISTSEGLMPTHVARKKKIGGELIAEIH